MSKKYLIRERELIYFSPTRGFLTVSKEQHNFKEILDYLLQDDFSEEELVKMINQRSIDLEKVSNGAIKKNKDGSADLCGKIKIPREILRKIEELKTKGFEWRQYENFWKRCLNNPNPESVEMLFRFLEKQNLTICEDGCFLAYKGVSKDLKDIHTGTFDNSPGQVCKMPREDVAFDPNTACHTGLHCGALEYASSFGPVVVLVKVDPANVVSVPYDCDAQKIRVCEYKVEKIYSGVTPISTGMVDASMKPVEVENIRKGGWTLEETKLLKKLCKHVPRVSWKEIGQRLMRSGEACRKKWELIKD